MTGHALEHLTFRTLEPEAWGDRLRRARGDRQVIDVEDTVSQLVPAGRNTIRRMEKLTAPPKDRRRRAIAVLALLSYGYNPRDFGFDITYDLPSGYSVETAIDVLRPQSACSTGNWVDRIVLPDCLLQAG